MGGVDHEEEIWIVMMLWIDQDCGGGGGRGWKGREESTRRSSRRSLVLERLNFPLITLLDIRHATLSREIQPHLNYSIGELSSRSASVINASLSRCIHRSSSLPQPFQSSLNPLQRKLHGLPSSRTLILLLLFVVVLGLLGEPSTSDYSSLVETRSKRSQPELVG